MKFSVAIPTYNRLNELADLLESIRRQVILPDEILIIDDGDLTESYISEQKALLQSDGISLQHYRKDHALEPRGSTQSRNISLQQSVNLWVFILDDDLILQEGFFARIMEIWEQNKDDPNLLAVGGLAINERRKRNVERFYDRLFGLKGPSSWDVNPVGYQVWDSEIKAPTKGYYLAGGIACYQRETALKLSFRALAGGRTALEDVEFFLRAKKAGYHCILEPAAQVIHRKSKVSREGEFVEGWKEGNNRKKIFHSLCSQSLRYQLWFGWASLGWILRQFLVGHFHKGFGILSGMLAPEAPDA